MPSPSDSAPHASPDAHAQRGDAASPGPPPDAVVAGAPKCGTSSLFAWLADHPGTVPSLSKETCFLVDRDSSLFSRALLNIHSDGPEAYGRCFPQGAGLRFEATPDYLYQRTAPEVLASLRPVPEILFVLRRPSRRVLSAYRFFRGPVGILDRAMSFEAYVAALLEGQGADALGHPLVASGLQDSRYAHHLRRWLELLPRDKMHVLLFEDLRADPRAFMHRICALLGLDGSFYDDYDFRARNRSFQVRSRLLQRLKNRVEPVLADGPLRSLMRWGYRAANVVPHRSRPEEALARPLAALDDYFAPEVEELAAMFDLDLSAWRAG